MELLKEEQDKILLDEVITKIKVLENQKMPEIDTSGIEKQTAALKENAQAAEESAAAQKKIADAAESAGKAQKKSAVNMESVKKRFNNYDC